MFFQTGVRESVDKAGLAAAIDRAKAFGEDFDLVDHVTVSTPTEFKKRKIGKR